MSDSIGVAAALLERAGVAQEKADGFRAALPEVPEDRTNQQVRDFALWNNAAGAMWKVAGQVEVEELTRSPEEYLRLTSAGFFDLARLLRSEFDAVIYEISMVGDSS